MLFKNRYSHAVKAFEGDQRMLVTKKLLYTKVLLKFELLSDIRLDFLQNVMYNIKMREYRLPMVCGGRGKARIDERE